MRIKLPDGMVKVLELEYGLQNTGIDGLHMVVLNATEKIVVVIVLKMVISMYLKDLLKLQNMHTTIMESIDIKNEYDGLSDRVDGRK